jgi:hypothetical protein
MRRHAIVAMTALIALAFGTARASEWVSVVKVPDGGEYFVDASSIRVVGVTRRAWVKRAFAPQTFQAPKGTEDAGKWVTVVMMHYEFNCREETSRLETFSSYFEDGTNHTQPPGEPPTPWALVAPDTAENSCMHFICAWKPK